ncbi:ribonuclease HII [Candidatus Woesebacteria bacterium]|nr:ribonuclease HII [Candidatus Woesebacteria bacterium]
MKVSKTPNFSFERKLWKRLSYVAGVDEVGRGSFAGAVVAGCVIFEKGLQIPENIKINDSKKLTSRQRERTNDWIKENALSWGIGEVQASVINRLGMAKATKMAFRKAISEARKRPRISIDFLLVDAFFIPYVRQLPKGRQMAIIDGDEKSISIGAASIIAKVYRDKMMLRLGKRPKFKKYGWGRNKGYGTRKHQLAIKKYGITRYHRKAFVKNFA